ncbi:undecaprenyldiphospho-muramoylpentapeptide beta-N- acetylglucosaminyltransferase [Saccharicrinis fermentans DSM 9555 = JCM 21142]|uniref:Undecaprenyldiphospho-muramoylpentapeptide beta-N-acetylglucosaminyltransferase n=1 Tax=Saccharicrinis fermentans DSM 9555 = JCM 21142 TaxID=869213 RepID=W7YEB7_9BACT|nr:undecaprenyldiphospho-muramoylpentapeptide beta-N- acetylglucosaminyltransferase [Saccharicrinis fermentans DSM 9555 = JCM 21142]
MVCPLNWGLGHASRMIPLVHKLLQEGNQVLLGGDGQALQLISAEFPQLKTIHIPDIEVHFSPNKISLNLLNLGIRMLLTSCKEHRILKKVIDTNTIDVIISDNRYGLWSTHIKSILVTHQPMIKLPKPFGFAEFVVHLLLQRFIRRFNECWIPDYADKNKSLSGDLSHKYKLASNARFIGPLSRFNYIRAQATQHVYDIVVVLSGPEPMRTQLEEELRKVLLRSKYSTMIVQGKPHEKVILKKHKNVHSIAHLSAPQLKYAILKSALCICRSGYSSIMDITSLRVKAVLIPTPGQTEQLYLSQHLKHQFCILSQQDISAHLLSIIAQRISPNK